MRNVYQITRSVRQGCTLVCTTLLLLLTGCGGGGGGSLPTRVHPDVIVIPQSVDATLVNDVLTLTGQVPAGVKAGSVLVIGSGSGLLRKVTAVRSARGDTMELDTVQGTFEDVFEQTELHYTKEFGPDELMITDLADGVTVAQNTAKSPTGRADLNLWTTELSLKDVVLYGTKDNGIVAEGTLRLAFRLQWDLRITNSRIEYFRYVPIGTLQVEGKVKGKLSATVVEKKTRIGAFYGAPITVMAGPIPVVFRPQGTLYLKWEGKVEAGIEVGASASVTIKAGVEYRNNVWSPVTEATPSVEMPWDNWGPYVEFSARASLADFQTSLMCYGVVGPYLEIVSPFVEAKLTLSQVLDPIRHATLDLGWGITGNVGAHIEVLGHTLASYESPLAVEWRTTFPGFPKTIPLAGDGNVIIRSPSVAPLPYADGTFRRIAP